MRRIYRVDYHGGNLFSLVEAETPERAIEIARAWRARKYPKEAAADEYTVRPATERDTAWLAKFGGKPYMKMPPPARSKPLTACSRPSAPPDTSEIDESTSTQLTEPSLANLNDRWRVVEESVQWIVQRRERHGWRSRCFCTTRSVLLRDVRRLCDEVTAEALAVLEALPDRHPGLVAYEKSNFAKAKGAPGQAKRRLRVVAGTERAEAA